jgi:putative FmdB family regulatory protein
MPLYEYKCERCQTVFEVIQKFSDSPLEVHEGCGGRVERLLSSPALQFKGSGWYITDYGKSGNGNSNGNGSKKASSETKSESKAESKPASTEKK